MPEYVDMVMNINTDDVLRDIVRDGVELRAVERVLAEWFEKHGYVVGMNQWSDRKPRAMHADGRYLDGKDQWETYHEMLADLLARVDRQNGGAP